MEWKPDKTRGIPLYLQIADYFEERINYGEYPPGSFLPSERNLSKNFNLNRNTVVAAYDVLFSKGLVRRIKGKGTQVSGDIWGLSEHRVPDWNLYTERGSFLPNMPIFQHIREEIQESKLVDFASGELSHDLMPYLQFKQTLSNQEFPYTLGYEHPQGNVELRQTLVDHLKSYRNIDCTSHSILVTSGAQQALHLIVQCLLNKGDSVAIEDPSYAYSLPIFKSAGIKTHSLYVDKTGVNPEQIIQLYKKHRIKMIFLNPIFQNPTGSVLSIERRKRIIELSSELRMPIIEDDPYSLVSFDHKTRNDTLKSMDKHGNVLYVSSLTKIAASGLRIGWIVGPQNVIQRLADAKQQIDFGHSIFPEWVATKFLSSNSFAEHLTGLKLKLHEKRNIICSALDHYLSDYIEYEKPSGGIHLWCKIAPNIDEYRLLENALRNNVVFVPGSLLGSRKGYLRLTYGKVNIDEIITGIEKLKQAFLRTLDEKKP